MSFKLVKGYDMSQPMYCGTSSSVTAGAVCVFDVSTGAAVSPVIPATAALLSCNVAGVAMNTPAAADTHVNILPIVPGQLWEYDCTSTPSTAMLGKINDLTDASTVANSTTISTAATGFVRNIQVVDTTNKIMRGYIVGANLPKALS